MMTIVLRSVMSSTDKELKPKRKARLRRTPEEARALILSAAAEVFAELGPDRAGLKDVAARAGVSHGLVTHYFGTFDGLVEQVLALRMGEMRENLLAQIAGSAAQLSFQDLIHVGVRAMRDPVVGRLMAWAFLSGRLAEVSFFAHERKGLRAIVDALMRHPEIRHADVSRDLVERRIVIVWCALLSYGVAAPTLWSALGETHTDERDRAIEADLLRIATAGLATSARFIGVDGT